MNGTKKYIAALYMRLSKDDGAGESASIAAQRAMLRAYAQDNSYTVFDEYVDDGVSGTTFDRPEFKRMIRDIEDKRVNMVITKDLSRLGRDYIITGQYTEIYFPSKNVRYIAVNDGYDSESPYGDIAPFKNVINEMYARDTSKKIRSSFEARMREGEFVGAFAPYGYMRDPYDKHRLIIDVEPAKIIKFIFSKAATGILPIDIAGDLNLRGVSTPLEYRRTRQIYKESFGTGEWTSQTITKILHNIVYIGHMAQGKTTKVSFKSDVSIKKSPAEWFVVENTHEPIVSKEIFDIASRRSKQRTCQKKGQFNNIFSGLAKCADCTHNMSTVVSRKKGATANLACGRYKLHGSSECTNHFIDYDILYSIVLCAVSELMTTIDEQTENEILNEVIKRRQQGFSGCKFEQKTETVQKRVNELDVLIEKLYEDYARGFIAAEQMNKLLQKYSFERKKLDTQKMLFSHGTKLYKEDEVLTKLREILRGYTKPTHLTQDMLFLFIERIDVYQGEYIKTQNGTAKRQTVKILFKFQKPENFFYTQEQTDHMVNACLPQAPAF